MEFLRWALIVPDAVTAGGHSWRVIAEAVCGQSLSGVDAAALLVAIVLEYKFHAWSVFGKLHAQLEV